MIYIPVLIASFLGSLHCLGMCGGFVACYSSQPSKRPAISHFAYSLGRLVSYISLGALAGVVGAGLNRSAALVGLNKLAALMAGVLLILMGLRMLQRANRGESIMSTGGAGFVTALYQRLLNSPRAVPAWGQAFLLGLFSTLLPCGYLYTFVAAAAATGSLASGALLMLFFWLGTLPAMLGFAYLLGRPLGRLAPYAPRLAAIILIAIGSYSVYGHFQHQHHDHSQHQHNGKQHLNHTHAHH